MSKDQKEQLKKLQQFYKEIAIMTMNHNVIDDRACVTADRLGKALEKVDTNWFHIK